MAPVICSGCGSAIERRNSYFSPAGRLVCRRCHGRNEAIAQVERARPPDLLPPQLQVTALGMPIYTSDHFRPARNAQVDALRQSLDDDARSARQLRSAQSAHPPTATDVAVAMLREGRTESEVLEALVARREPIESARALVADLSRLKRQAEAAALATSLAAKDEPREAIERALVEFGLSLEEAASAAADSVRGRQAALVERARAAELARMRAQQPEDPLFASTRRRNRMFQIAGLAVVLGPVVAGIIVALDSCGGR